MCAWINIQAQEKQTTEKHAVQRGLYDTANVEANAYFIFWSCREQSASRNQEGVGGGVTHKYGGGFHDRLILQFHRTGICAWNGRTLPKEWEIMQNRQKMTNPRFVMSGTIFVSHNSQKNGMRKYCVVP